MLTLNLQPKIRNFENMFSKVQWSVKIMTPHEKEVTKSWKCLFDKPSIQFLSLQQVSQFNFEVNSKS
jgi:hypothetical protein